MDTIFKIIISFINFKKIWTNYLHPACLACYKYCRKFNPKKAATKTEQLKVKERIGKLPFPFTTGETKGSFICIQCAVLGKPLNRVDRIHGKLICRGDSCGASVATPKWISIYINFS